MIEPLDDAQADRTVKHYACSACWGHLVKYPAPNRQWHVKCPVCGDATRGYVKRSYVERRLKESQAEAVEAREALKGAMPTLATRRTQAETLADLGY